MVDVADLQTLIRRASDAANVVPDKAENALIGALGLLDRHADRHTLSIFYAALPQAKVLAQGPEAKAMRGGGLFGGLMKAAGGVSGAAISEAMGLMTQLKRQGIEKDDLKRLLPAFREQVRRATGHDLLGDVVRTVPGVGPLLGDG